MKSNIISTVLFLTLPFGLFASPQMPDYIIYGKDTIATYNLILETYLQKLDSTKTDKLFGLSFRDGSSFSCWRGYQAVYKIENDSLFLVNIINCGELRNGKIDKKQSFEKMKSIFSEKFTNGKVYIDWFDGDVNFPLTNRLLRWDGVFYKIFEKERVINISKGAVQKVEDFENYIDDPNRIDRRDKHKISELLFEKLHHKKWKKADNCDCSEKYFVTINELGNVSKIKMIDYDTPEKIEQNWERAEYNYCVNTMFKRLKKLKFDIIKDKGKAMSEDIYIEIWTKDDGEIENWTR